MISKNEELVKYDKQFIRAIQEGNVEKLEDLLSSSIKKPYIQIPDQTLSMLTGYQILYTCLSDSSVERINTEIGVLVCLGRYMNLQTPEFMELVKEYDHILANRNIYWL